MLGILGGVIHYYSVIYSEPTILPAYGTIYVEEVYPSNYTLVVVNKYGYAVKALFSARIASITPRPSGYVPPVTTFWYTIRPGKNAVDLLSEAKKMLPSASSIVIDLDNSYFIIGSLKYPIKKGAGLFKPYDQTSVEYKTYSWSGIGVADISPPHIYGSLYFTDKKVGVTTTSNVNFGYYRSIYSYEEVTHLVRYEHGTRCHCWTEGYCVSVWKIDPITNQTYCGTTCPGYVTCGSESYEYRDYRTFGCAYDGGSYLYWVTESSSLSSTLNTIALYGASYFTKDFAVDYVVNTGGGTSYRTSDFPYIKPNQNECYYTYVEIIYTTDLRQESFNDCNECPHVSCFTIYYTDCTEKSNRIDIPNIWACDSKLCAGLDRYLYARITNIYSNVTSLLTSGDKILLRFNITYTLDYYFAKSDPELADSYVRIDMSNLLSLTFPKVSGYLSVKYTNDIRGVSVSITPYMKDLKTMVRTASGYSSSFVLSTTISGSTATATLTPVGYVAVSGSNLESAKTFKYETGNLYASLSFRTLPHIPVPMRNSDTVYIIITFELELVPRLTVDLTEVSG